MKNLVLLVTLSVLVSACSSSNTASRPLAPLSKDTVYFQQMTPVSAKGVVEPLDTTRYSAMHITQASYLFK